MNITYKQAATVLDAAKQKSEELRALVSISIVDTGGHLVSFARLGTPYGLVDFAIKKARTAVMFGVASEVVGLVIEGAGVNGSGLVNSNNGLITVAGGVLIKDKNGNAVGAIASSGGTPEQDKEIAQAGASTLL